ncbi:hypothetical protein NDU88_000317 [Pleurodeles waltl]|uniref:Uncharacterized protein n=1 Tax=Pleurodeles waltl TaxID=8319 RepID=A0AAV7LXU7_PLEWA|nr:hypothetical protein NDU88_000317 [Pleurodeles waltl]
MQISAALLTGQRGWGRAGRVSCTSVQRFSQVSGAGAEPGAYHAHQCSASHRSAGLGQSRVRIMHISAVVPESR